MDYVTFGRTGLNVSSVGLGAGGASKLGLGSGADERQAIGVIRRALELGVTYIDTAKGYGTEQVVGNGLRGVRDSIVLSSKAYVTDESGSYVSPSAFREAIEDSLRKLQTSMIDVYHLHRLTIDEYEYALAEIIPVLERCKDEGKIRFFGISESTSKDSDHDALAKAAEDAVFDVLMTGFNFFNQGSRARVFPHAIKNDIAIEIMGAARGPYSRPELLRAEVERLVGTGDLRSDQIDVKGPLNFLTGPNRAATLAEAAYRFARYEPGVHVVLVGTGNIAHLEENIDSLQRGPLPEEGLRQLYDLFGHLRVSRG